MDIRALLAVYQNSGLSRPMASARVCQDIVLKAIADSTLSRNVTIKGGVVMRSITNNNRRATRDIDIDFIHYPLTDESIIIFIQRLNVITGIVIEIDGEIEELKHQDYHGKGIKLRITDDSGYSVISKMDIGVHKHLDIEQDEYLFDVSVCDDGVSLLKNTAEQTFAEKLRSLLKFGANSFRYKDIYDLYYLKDVVNRERLNKVMKTLIFDDLGMKENNYSDVLKRLEMTFENKNYLLALSNSWQRWIDNDIYEITGGIVNYLSDF